MIVCPGNCAATSAFMNSIIFQLHRLRMTDRMSALGFENIFRIVLVGAICSPEGGISPAKIQDFRWKLLAVSNIVGANEMIERIEPDVDRRCDTLCAL
jgi:hypothetical protein